MRRVLLRRLAHSLLVVTLVVTATFVLVRLAPGDPFITAFADESLPADARSVTSFRKFSRKSPR